MRWSRVIGWVGLCLALWGGASGALAQTEPLRFDGVARVVAVGDAHGAYQQLVGVLRQAGLVDGQAHWTGGEAHLVSLGDLLDRGAESRMVMDLFMRLQVEAAAAGGRVHVVVGNHELMNLTDDLRYVSGAEFAAFADDEDPAEREAARVAYEALPEQSRPQPFDTRYPPGFFGHRAAFSAEGVYGQWLRAQPFLLVVNDTVFVHGGLSPLLEGHTLEEANLELAGMLQEYETQWLALKQAMGIVLPLDFDQREDLARQLPDDAGEGLARASALPLFYPAGPLWSRESSLCIPATIEDTVDRVLRDFGARRVVVGHTVTYNKRMGTRLEGKVIMADTGMLNSYYTGGIPSALEITGEALKAMYLDEPGLHPLAPVPRRVGARQGNLSDDELEQWLAEAQVVSMEELGEGVTKPRKVVLTKDGLTMQAVFKTVDHREQRSRNKVIALADRWRFEVAAYRLDRLLDLGLVPVTIQRSIGDETGSLQFWVEGMVNQIQILEQNMSMAGWCPIAPQLELLKTFDGLIYNVDRTQQNLTFVQGDWLLVAIDHSRSFESARKLPDAVMRSPYLSVRPAMAQRLRSLDSDMLKKHLDKYLNYGQIGALLSRRDRLLKDHVEHETRVQP